MPPDPVCGVPAIVARPLPLSTNVTPGGSVPVADIVVATGEPTVRTWNDPAVPTLNVADAVETKRSPVTTGRATRAPPVND